MKRKWVRVLAAVVCVAAGLGVAQGFVLFSDVKPEKESGSVFLKGQGEMFAKDKNVQRAGATGKSAATQVEVFVATAASARAQGNYLIMMLKRIEKEPTPEGRAAVARLINAPDFWKSESTFADAYGDTVNSLGDEASALWVAMTQKMGTAQEKAEMALYPMMMDAPVRLDGGAVASFWQADTKGELRAKLYALFEQPYRLDEVTWPTRALGQAEGLLGEERYAPTEEEIKKYLRSDLFGGEVIRCYLSGKAEPRCAGPILEDLDRRYKENRIFMSSRILDVSFLVGNEGAQAEKEMASQYLARKVATQLELIAENKNVVKYDAEVLHQAGNMLQRMDAKRFLQVVAEKKHERESIRKRLFDQQMSLEDRQYVLWSYLLFENVVREAEAEGVRGLK